VEKKNTKKKGKKSKSKEEEERQGGGHLGNFVSYCSCDSSKVGFFGPVRDLILHFKI
jgi:hypothetical protein